LRRGGVSEKALLEVTQSFEQLQITVKAKKHNEFKPESEKLEGPGQFLRHYSPNIESYLFTGKFESDNNFNLEDSVLIDYNGLLSKQKD